MGIASAQSGMLDASFARSASGVHALETRWEVLLAEGDPALDAAREAPRVDARGRL